MTAALHIPYDNFRRDRDEILHARESQTREERANSFKRKGKEKGIKWRKKWRNSENAKRGEFGTSSKVQLNYYTILIDANDVRIIMIIVIILTIGNSPILSLSLSIQLIRLGQLRNDLSFSLTLNLFCLSVYPCLSVCLSTNLLICLSFYQFVSVSLLRQ